MWLAILLACGSDKNPAAEPATEDSSETTDTQETGRPNDSGIPPVETTYIPLSELQQLNRISMTLRGVRPDGADILTVLDDPSQLDSIIDSYLDSPDFGRTVRDLYAEVLQMRAFDITLPALGDLADHSTIERNTAMSEEPLGLIEAIVMSNRPLHEMVTLNQTHLDPTAALLWNNHSYDESIGGSQIVSWTDGRPPAGVLTSNALLVRWESNGDNNNRERANMVSTAFLCENYAERDIPLTGGIDLSDAEAVADAVNLNPQCVACHQSLDPLAAHFWGFRNRIRAFQINAGYTNGCSPGSPCYPIDFYYALFEDQHESLGLRPPNYFGAESTDTESLGAHIAADPRFALCQATHFASYLTQRTHDDIPYEDIIALSEVLTESSYSAKALAKAVVTHPTFLSQSTDPIEAIDELAGLQIIRPEQYARLLKSLTGFEWIVGVSQGNYGNADLLNNDVVGFRMMSGGIDGVSVNSPTHMSTPNRLLMMRAAAQDAAGFVVDFDLAQPIANRKLLMAYTGNSEAEIRVLLQDLHRRILLEDLALDSAELDDSFAFVQSALATTSDPKDALKLFVAAMLQSPDVLFY